MIRPPLTDATKALIASLLKSGINCQSVVNCVKHDHGTFVSLRSVREISRSLGLVKEKVVKAFVVSDGFVLVDEYRCPGCGGKTVFAPCRKCALEWKSKTFGKLPAD